MKTIIKQTIGFAMTLAVSITAFAHDPSMHTESNENPDCSAMKDMDHSNMDSSDPVMQAMMKKCMAALHGEQESSGMHDEHDSMDMSEMHQMHQEHSNSTQNDMEESEHQSDFHNH